MKNILKSLTLLLLVVTFSCSNNDSRFSDNPESGWVQFDSPADATYFNEAIIAEGITSIEVPVSFTAPVNKSDLVVSYDVVNVNGNASEVISTGNSVTFAANTNTALNPLTLNIDLDALGANIFTNYEFDIVLTGTNRSTVNVGVDGDESFATSYRVSMSAPCQNATIAGGMYSVYTEYGFHDFLPDYSTATIDMEVVDNGDGTYFVTDLSGGLYSQGPYVAAYGTDDTAFDAVFFTVCDNITWENQNDPWGTAVPQADGVNMVDTTNGTFTISWFCNGYGENGVSVYTPL
ncbi:MAG: hypothetical protein BM564_08025 [Bacteroidetes bacterium MedPE-SWsnd-G2]|nr:MAG: hypothetical protein BM564_08025 [Bacteroidetes bacterium MedPE-SWsnd-G2]